MITTIKDIANKADVSTATVSRVLNYDRSLSINESTRKRIFEVVEELNYTKHLSKMNMSKSQNLKIAILQFRSSDDEISDLYYLSIRMGIEKIAAINSVQVTVLYSVEDLATVDFDGVLVIGGFPRTEMEEIVNKHRNICFIDNYEFIDSADYVRINFQQAMRHVIDFFLSRNHKKIGYIGTNVAGEPHDQREAILKGILSKHELYNPEFFYIYSEKLTADLGYNIMKEILKTPKKDLPSAFFIANDSMAIGALKAINEKGLSVPNDFDIVGFNDISIAKYSNPPLTTVRVHMEELGEAGFKLLTERINNADENIEHIVTIGTKLINRSSTN